MYQDQTDVQELRMLPTAAQAGLSGPEAYIYEGQIAILQALEQPAFMVDLSMLVLSNMEQAVLAAEPARRSLVRLQCQQVISHHVFLGTALLELMRTRDHRRFQEAMVGFGSRLAKDVATAVASAGAGQATNAGTLGAVGVAGGGHVAVATVTAAALDALSKRMEKEGEIFFAAFFTHLFDGGRHESERRRWLLGVETLLAAACARLSTIGAVPTVADIGRRYRRDIVEVHVIQWREDRTHMKWWFLGGGVVVGLWILLGSVVHVLAKIGWNLLGIVKPDMVDASAGSTTWTFLSSGLAAAAVLGTAVAGWALLTTGREGWVRWSAGRRIDCMVRQLDLGLQAG